MPGHEVIGKEERKHVDEVLENGCVLMRHGFQAQRKNQYKVENLEAEFCSRFKVKHSLAVSSGTAALRVALAALNLPKNSFVVTQSFTFVATVEAIVEAGCIPVCLDIDDTLNLCPSALDEALTELKISAIIVVHMLGTPARMSRICALAREKNIPIIEDTAWGLGATYNGMFLGTIGDIGTFSFDYAKAITTGEGGMVVTNDPTLDFRSRAWHDHGHENNPNVARWEDTRHSSGFNYRMSELTAAIGLGQFEKFELIFDTHRRNALAIWDAIKDFSYIKKRACEECADESLEALIFEVKDASTAGRLKEHLAQYEIATKILPEAITWHFAKTWNHIPEILLLTDLSKSHARLSRCISLPVNIQQSKDHPKLVRNALETFKC